MRQLQWTFGWVLLLGAQLGCSSQPLSEPQEEGNGSLRAAIELGERTRDVAAVRFDLVSADGACDAPALMSKTVTLEGELAPQSLTGSDDGHHFASGLFVVEPGAYRICATPLRDDSTPSSECATAAQDVTVVAGETTQASLVSQCRDAGSGGVDVGLALNGTPEIVSVTVTDSTYITVCESAVITVEAIDPDADALDYEFTLVSGPAGARLRPDGTAATFSAPPGEHVVRVAVADSHGASASFLVTMRVSDATCEVPPGVFDIFSAKCSPCHTTGASGGLKLAPADVAYASLVDRAVGAAACSTNVRVVPGDASASYLIAKLRGTPGICGLPMPRNLPALPEEEIQTIESWIDTLPH